VAHPNYDEFWKRHAVAYGLKQSTVPNLNVAGWWDQEDFYGPVATYERLEKVDKKNLNFLAAGPWNHGGWGNGPGRNRWGRFPSAATRLFIFGKRLKPRGLPTG